MEDYLCSNNTVVRKQRSSPINRFNGAQLISLDSVLILNLHFQSKHVTTTFFLPCSPLTLKRASKASTDSSALVNLSRSLKANHSAPLLYINSFTQVGFFFPGSLYKPFNQELCETFEKARHIYYAGNICIFGPDS